MTDEYTRIYFDFPLQNKRLAKMLIPTDPYLLLKNAQNDRILISSVNIASDSLNKKHYINECEVLKKQYNELKSKGVEILNDLEVEIAIDKCNNYKHELKEELEKETLIKDFFKCLEKK